MRSKLFFVVVVAAAGLVAASAHEINVHWRITQSADLAAQAGSIGYDNFLASINPGDAANFVIGMPHSKLEPVLNFCQIR